MCTPATFPAKEEKAFGGQTQSPKIRDPQAFSTCELKKRSLKVAALNLPRLGETNS
jgi:hypothetical protein